MSRTKLVFFGGSKGGVGKSATSDLLPTVLEKLRTDPRAADEYASWEFTGSGKNGKMTDADIKTVLALAKAINVSATVDNEDREMVTRAAINHADRNAAILAIETVTHGPTAPRLFPKFRARRVREPKSIRHRTATALTLRALPRRRKRSFARKLDSETSVSPRRHIPTSPARGCRCSSVHMARTDPGSRSGQVRQIDTRPPGPTRPNRARSAAGFCAAFELALLSKHTCCRKRAPPAGTARRTV